MQSMAPIQRNVILFSFQDQIRSGALRVAFNDGAYGRGQEYCYLSPGRSNGTVVIMIVIVYL